MRSTWRLAMVLIILCALPMLGQQGVPNRGNDKTAAAENWSELTSSMEKMHEGMASVAPSGDGDVDFVRLMLPHHQAAIDMAKAELMYGKDPQMQRLAQEIITDQQSEMELMRLWLKRHGPKPPNVSRALRPGARKGH